MNEVSAKSAAILLDAVEQRGLDAADLRRDIDVDLASLRRGKDRIDWETWVAMLARVAEVSPVPMDQLFVAGAGDRLGHPFVRIAQGLLSLADLYTVLARWGTRAGFQTMHGRAQMMGSSRMRFTMSIDPTRQGSLPSLQMFAGVLRLLPQLQGYPAARVHVLSATPHRMDYVVELPPERTLLGRARRALSAITMTTTALDELERQAEEIAAKNLELEAQLAATHERDEWLEVALGAGHIGLWRWDPQTRRVRISGRLVEWLGTDGATEIDTAAWTRTIHPDDQPVLAKLMTEALATRAPFETEYRITRTGGELLWLALKGRTEVDRNGRVYAYGSAVDITAEKDMERRLRLADRLISAGTLAAGIAHEINNPLTYILGSVELVQRRLRAFPQVAAATSDLLAQMLDGVERIRAVVADVRVFARQDEDMLGPVDARAVCMAAIRIVSTDIRHRATIAVDLADDTPSISANDAKLGQVIINLLVNASQAMPPRAPDENIITVRTRRLPSGEAMIEVEDNGVGIPPEVLPRLFDPFFTTKPIGVGTGLGLAVCAGIVSSLGGRIDVDSAPLRGSRFSVILPGLAKQPRPSAPVLVAKLPPTTARVLVIDDEVSIRTIVASSLASHGFDVAEADSGRAGLEAALAGDARQVILCDLMMPDLDGASLHAKLVEQRPELARRIMFISGGAVTERARSFIERPDVIVLQKPFALERLIAEIERLAAA